MAWLVARTTASHAARVAAGILHDDPAALSDAWRFAILQLLDDYNAAYRQHGSQAAADLFTTPPAASGDRRIDAALAALAEHLARRDGWRPPAWAFDPERYAEPWWFVAGLTSLHAMALVQSPAAFRKRGVFITDGDLDRV